MAAPYTLLIEKDGTNKFWHTHNGITAGRFAIEGDFTFTIDGNKCKVVEKDGASRFVYLAENISIKDNTDAGVVETGFSPVSLRNRLRELGYPKENSIEVLGLTTDELDAIHNAASPSASNPFATMDDVGGGGASGLSFHTNFAAFPATGNITTLYIDKTLNQVYRWNGSAYVKQDRQTINEVVAVDSELTHPIYGHDEISSTDATTYKGAGITPLGLIIAKDAANAVIIDADLLTTPRNQQVEDADGVIFVDTLKRDGSNANTNVDLGNYEFAAGSVRSKNGDNSKFVALDQTEGVQIQTNQYKGSIASDDLLSDTKWQLPENGGAGGTLAGKDYVDGKVAGLLDLRGNHDASGNTYPSSGGSGTAGAILKGDFWYISVAGTLGGVAVNVGDSIYALVDSPGTTSSNWAVLDSNLSYVPEDTSNKSTSVITDQASNTKFPSVKSVFDWAVSLFATKAMGAYKFRVNNTNATADATETNFKSIAKTTLSTTPTFSAGTAPSGSTSHSYSGQHVGSTFFGKIDLFYGVAGATVTSVVVPLPSDWPTPIRPDGFTAASERVAIGVGYSGTNTTGVGQAQYACILRANSGNTGFELVLSQASASSRYFHLTITYPTA